ncbi:glucose-6-phosphate isomerase [Ureibacillus chungkukjangi]|uniref:glucose-6-phosphate isomerase n=1 Tax=Ureibacillus chungkukjangi TaxID=1202712 RepID=UPI00384AAFE1
MVISSLRKVKVNDSFPQIDWASYSSLVSDIHHHMEEANINLTGWINHPLEQQDCIIRDIQELAFEIKTNADVFIVIGIGGSYLGAKAIQDALTPYFGCHPNGIEVIYVGQSMSGSYINQLLSSLENREVYLNVISKSGNTIEPAVAFRILRSYLEGRYGEEAHRRIIVTTDGEKGILKQLADQEGYRQFAIPSNIGGRYSVLTPVGLLPIAVAGIDISQLLEGAKIAALKLKEENVEHNDAYRYAVIRYELYKRGYQIELLASFEPSLANFHKWWQQLFAESEGKEKRGLYPAAVNYSTDLHSVGQFIQEGNPILFETVLHFHETKEDCFIPYNDTDVDHLNYLSSKSFNEINDIFKNAVVAAHSEGRVPVLLMEFKSLDAFHMGYLIYFFMKACAMSSYLLDVNPFDQPGVEAYKSKIQNLLQVDNAYL